jgi:hypothetical protein
VFAIVEHEEDVLGAQHVDDGLCERPFESPFRVDCLGYGRHDGVLIGQRGELHHSDAVTKLGSEATGYLNSERGFSYATRSGEGDQPRGSNHRFKFVEG